MLGRKGELRALMAGIGAFPAEDRPRIGALANPVREAIEAAIAERRERLESIALEVRLAAEREDVTLPGRAPWRGGLHPIRETEREIARVLGQFGFVVVESPEVETDALNFEALNIPADHPARDLWDTIYVADPATAAGSPATRRMARRAGCCGPIPRPARSGPCGRRSPPSASSPPAAATATSRSMPAMASSSSRWRG